MDNKAAAAALKPRPRLAPILLLLFDLVFFFLVAVVTDGAEAAAAVPPSRPAPPPPPPSSFSPDDEDDLTAELTRQQLIELRNRIMNSLGLTRVPDVSKANVTAEEKAEAYRLYFEQIQGTPQEAQQQRPHHHHHHHNHHHNHHQHHHRHRVLTRDLKQENRKGASVEEERNVIEEPLATQQVFSFETTDVNGALSPNASASVSFPMELTFSANVPRGSSVTSVVLRIYKMILGNTLEPLQGSFATFHVYRVLPSEMSLVASQRVPVRGDEWVTVDLSILLDSWSEEDQTFRLRLECFDCEMLNLTVAMLQPSAGTNESFPTVESPKDPMTFQNLSLGTTNGTGPSSGVPVQIKHLNPSLDIRVAVYDSTQRRQRRSPKRKRKQEKTSSYEDNVRKFNPLWEGTTNCTKKTRGKCCRHAMYVNFTVLEMDFVVEPAGFDAYFCKGKCPNLYNAAHTHALIQSTMTVKKVPKVPRPCCAPSKLSNLTIIIMDEMGKFRVTHLDDAVVEECACS